MSKQRLDIRVAQEFPEYTRMQIRSWIMQGKVLVDERPVTKAGTQVREDQTIRLKDIDDRFVCRSGWKLHHAISAFNLDVTGKVVLDAGVSTGGFTDCLLQEGASKVYGVDVGYGQVHEKVRKDRRVRLLERTNLRTLTDIGESVDMVTLDLSFISVLKVMDAVVQLLKPNGELVVLIKPQFEAGRHDVPKGGVIRDQAMQERIVRQVMTGIQAYGFLQIGVTPSPITGTKGNQEYIAYFRREQHAEKVV